MSRSIDSIPSGGNTPLDEQYFHEYEEAVLEGSDQNSFGERSRFATSVALLDRFIEQGEGKKGRPGEFMSVVQWGRSNIGIAIFDLASRQQIGTANGYVVNLFKREFSSEVLIGEGFRNRGIGSLALDYLKTFIPPWFSQDHIKFLHVIVGNDIATIRKMLRRAGAIPTGQRIKEGFELWEETVTARVGQKIPESITADKVAFTMPASSTELQVPSGFSIEGSIVVFNGYRVGSINGKEIRLLSPENTSDSSYVADHWKAVGKLWQGLRGLQYIPSIIY